MFRCSDLLLLPSMTKARPLAGKEGMNNLIRWVYKPEDMNFSKWVRGNELLIISLPVIKSPHFDLYRLLEKAVSLHMAGMILLVGEHYITAIPDNVLSYANRHSFPIFSISGDVPLIDIFEEIGHAIAYDDQREMSDNGLFTNIIFGNAIDTEHFIRQCSAQGYDILCPQQMFILKLSCRPAVSAYDSDPIMDPLLTAFQDQNIPVLLSRFGNNFIGCFSSCLEKDPRINQIYKAILTYIKKSCPGSTIRMGIGTLYEGVESLHKSYHEAAQCIKLMELLNHESDLLFYEDTGLYRLLLSCCEKQPASDFINHTLGAVLSYDKDNHTDLFNTLRCYLWNNNSLLHTAEKLHMHRNTVKYRIKRIEELTGRSIEDSDTKLAFMNAILCTLLSRSI